MATLEGGPKMRPKRVPRLLLLGAISLALGTAPSLAAGTKARAALEQAIAAAKQWQPDAILTNVSSLTVSDDGTAYTWFYAFYSPKTGKYMNVTAKGRQTDTLKVLKGLNDPVAPDFVDSDLAMEAAKKYGI